MCVCVSETSFRQLDPKFLVVDSYVSTEYFPRVKFKILGLDVLAQIQGLLAGTICYIFGESLLKQLKKSKLYRRPNTIYS